LSLPSELASIVDGLLDSALKNRNQDTRVLLQKRLDEAIRAGRQHLGFYAHDQQNLCVHEVNDRVDAIWSSYKRVIVEAGVPWTDDLRQHVLGRINALLDQDVPQLEDMARTVIVPYGHAFALFLSDARGNILQRITVEIDLFAVKYRALGADVILQLQADRYSGPRQHWTEVRAAFQESPPRVTHGAREAIHAVEGMAKIVVDRPDDTLGDCIKILKKREMLDGATAKTLEGLWGLTSSIPGLRHGATEEHVVAQALAEYIVGVAEAALKLLLSLDAPRI
jgi:hypothetical protein